MSRKLSLAVSILAILFIVICIGTSIYLLAVAVEKQACYSHLGRVYGVSPTVGSVHRAIDEKIQNMISSEVGRDEMMEFLNDIARTEVLEVSGPTRNGGTVEYLNIHICFFPQNNLDYAVYYSKGGTVEKGKLFIYGY